MQSQRYRRHEHLNNLYYEDKVNDPVYVYSGLRTHIMSEVGAA
jgi:hypothetical protein